MERALRARDLLVAAGPEQEAEEDVWAVTWPGAPAGTAYARNATKKYRTSKECLAVRLSVPNAE